MVVTVWCACVFERECERESECVCVANDIREWLSNSKYLVDNVEWACLMNICHQEINH